MNSGIYKITIDRWYYYGQTNNFNRRKRHHLSALKTGKHKNPILQRAFDKYHKFIFEECAYEDNARLITELEQLVIDECFGKEYCANLNPNASVPPTTRGTRLTSEHKSKLSAANKGKHKSDEQKAKMSAAKKGVPKSEEHKAKISEARKRYWEHKRLENKWLANTIT
jgi:group I intron endonuclease